MILSIKFEDYAIKNSNLIYLALRNNPLLLSVLKHAIMIVFFLTFIEILKATLRKRTRIRDQKSGYQPLPLGQHPHTILTRF